MESTAATGGGYGADSSFGVLQGVTEVADFDSTVEPLSQPTPPVRSGTDWNALPKDVKLYLMDFLPLDDYARLSMVSREWNRVARKHRKAQESGGREEAFERAKVERARQARLAAAHRRERAVAMLCDPPKRCCEWYCEHACACTCVVILVLMYVGWSAMTGLFLWSPLFVLAPYQLSYNEFRYPQAQFVAASCTVEGSIVSTLPCLANSLQQAFRTVFNVSIAGYGTNRAAVFNVGSAYADCGFYANLRNASNPDPATFAVGSTYPCMVDPLFVLSYAAVTGAPATGALRTKDWAFLNLTRADIDRFAQGDQYRSAGRILGYLWIAATVCFIYTVFLIWLKSR